MSVSVAAIDLGASSGRVVLGRVGADHLDVEVVARFANDPIRLPDGLHWNITQLYDRALDGLATAVARAGFLASVGVDSWAVDYALLRDSRLATLPYHYRDDKRVVGVDGVHAQLDFAGLYRRNGLQHLPFTTLYQLAAERDLDAVERLLLIPDLLTYWLSGQQVAERTNASTTGLVSIASGGWDTDLMATLGYRASLFAPLVDPGTVIAPVLPHVGDRIGQPDLPVVAVGSHDTASAVVAVPMRGRDAAYISCGTWGLVGLELDEPVLSSAAMGANFTNEGGVDGRIRFLTNVMGLWLLSESLRHWGLSGDQQALTGLLDAAAEVEGTACFDVQDERFLAPGDMPSRIEGWLNEHDLPVPQTRAAMVRCIISSLAGAFAQAVRSAQELSGRTVETVHIVGGGALNSLLCQLTADRCERTVLAGPVEATALGNVLIQARACGALTGDLEDLRDLVARTQQTRQFVPRARRHEVAS